MTSEATNYYTLITGASSGIGKALALECARRGMNLFLIALPGNGFDSFVKAIRDEHKVKVDYLSIDLTLSDAPHQIYDHARQKGYKINMLFNNAGNGHLGKFEDMQAEKVEEMIHLNLRALTVICLLFINDMKSMKKAHILNVGSLGAYTPIAYKSVYAATKSYVYYFTKSLRHEYATTNIQFSVLMPGAVVTNAEIKERIQKAGFFGKISSLTPQYVASYTLRAMEKGRFMVMPGFANRSIFNVSACIPSGFLLYITGKVFSKSY
jgi:short-subunit dehydrogenase